MKHPLCFGAILSCFASVALIACGPGTSDADAGNDAPTAADTQHVTETGVDAGADVASMDDTAAMTDAAAMTDTALPPSDAGGACNALALGSHAATGTCFMTAVPAATGGAITPGIYDLTALNLYPTAPICGLIPTGGLTATVEFTATTMNTVSLDPPPATTINRATSTYVASGINLTGTRTCPTAQAPAATTYTATASTIHIYGTISSDGGSATIEEVLTLR